MKELSIKQKAQRYDEALEKARKEYKKHEAFKGSCEMLAHIFPELKESEDEKVIRDIKVVLERSATKFFKEEGKMPVWYDRAMAWLEKQGENTYNKELSELLHKVICRYINDPDIPYSDREKVSMEVLPYVERLEKQCEQKPADKVEPKFKQGDIIKEKETGNLFYVNSVEEFGYTLHYKNCIAKGCTMDFKYEDNYELVEQKPAWSEEDETKLKSACALIRNTSLNGNKDVIDSTIAWLKSLSPQNTWKPSDEQMEALENAIRYGEEELIGILSLLYNDLKKLREG